MTAQILRAQPLAIAAFAPFGDVIAAGGAGEDINDGSCVRFNDLARVETDAAGAAGLSVFRAAPRNLPLPLKMLERHPLGSQAFMPLSSRAFLVVVAKGNETTPDLSTLRAFKTAPGQGVNFHRGVWHHPLIALHAVCDFLVADRIGPGDNLRIFNFPAGTEFSLTE